MQALRAAAEAAPLIRFMTAGSVDDGKSTLIGRLMLDCKALLSDQVAALGEAFDLAALTDGLEAEREQGITIDVAYRYFATPKASFIIADAPGHEQYTRNMVTAASVSERAVILIDASRVEGGALKPQTRRHAALAAMMGLKAIVAVNKMDRVAWSQQRFREIVDAFEEAAKALDLDVIGFVPIAAKAGDNVVTRGGADWWDGPTLLDLLSAPGASSSAPQEPLRLPVQHVLRDGEARLYAGRIEAGRLAPGARVRVGPQRVTATVSQILVAGRPVPAASAGASVALRLAEDRDLARGDVIAAGEPRYVNEVEVDLAWLDDEPWRPGRRYRLRQGALETSALIVRVAFVRDMSDLSIRPDPGALNANDVARVTLRTRDPILADRFDDVPATGAVVLFDSDTHQTSAAGVIRAAGG